jgi:DNA modification methylase
MSVEIIVGDCRDKLAAMPAKSVHMAVTSPPYFGLRDYGTATWIGGAADCDHGLANNPDPKNPHSPAQNGGCRKGEKINRRVCRCGALRIDSQVGLEESPQEYIEKIVSIFAEVHRVLRDDGTLWLNIGDSYASNGGHSAQGESSARVGRSNVDVQNAVRGFRPGIQADGIKPKELIGIPWMLAFALRAAGWHLRQEIIWHKPNPMPESVQDRCTKAHEQIFLFTKGPQYFYDAEAIAEPALQPVGAAKLTGQNKADAGGFTTNGHGNSTLGSNQGSSTRNKRSVWTVTSDGFDIEMCKACATIYSADEHRSLRRERVTEEVAGKPVVKKRVYCRCGRHDSWLTHFAVFPAELIAIERPNG